MAHRMTHLRSSACRASVAALACGVALLGCSNENDEKLWGGQMAPTQIQKADEGAGPVEMPDPAGGDNQDPFTDDPDYPYSNGPNMGALRDVHE